MGINTANILIGGENIRLGRNAAWTVHFSVYAGQISFLRGPSGCGKTWLVKSLLGLVPPLTGLAPQPATGVTIRACLAHNAFFHHMNMRENLHYTRPADPPGTPTPKKRLRLWLTSKPDYTKQPEYWRRVEWLGGRLGMDPDCLNKYPTDFSEGERRRLDLIRVLSHPAGLYLLDEPFNGLDEDTSELVAGLLMEICEREKPGMLILSHIHPPGLTIPPGNFFGVRRA